MLCTLVNGATTPTPHAQARTYTWQFRSSDFLGGAKDLHLLFKIFENLRVDLVFLKSSALGPVRAVVKVLAGQGLRDLLMMILGLYLSHSPLTGRVEIQLYEPFQGSNQL